jgi:hypothetical protein
MPEAGGLPVHEQQVCHDLRLPCHEWDEAVQQQRPGLMQGDAWCSTCNMWSAYLGQCMTHTHTHTHTHTLEAGFCCCEPHKRGCLVQYLQGKVQSGHCTTQGSRLCSFSCYAGPVHGRCLRQTGGQVLQWQPDDSTTAHINWRGGGSLRRRSQRAHLQERRHVWLRSHPVLPLGSQLGPCLSH